jgi:superfamily II DNA helicase RecQ
VLLTQEDALAQKKKPASLRLEKLLGRGCADPLIVLATPELITGCLGSISRLATKNLISLVVIDEFDCVDVATPSFRTCYRDIVSNLKKSTTTHANWVPIPFLYLSGTGTEGLMNEILQDQPQTSTARPVLCLSKQVLPSNHVYSGKSKRTVHVGSFVQCA